MEFDAPISVEAKPIRSCHWVKPKFHNWLGGVRIGHGSFDTIANLLTQMFNFLRFRSNGVLFLNPNTGEKM
jgi:hypothetical protein